MSYRCIMESLDKQRIAGLVKSGRATKRYTQQDLADLTRISLRTVQRIENGEVLPRQYTLRLLEEHLGVQFTREAESGQELADDVQILSRDTNGKTVGSTRPKKVILTVGVGLLMLLLTGAYLAQSTRFPETDFERLLLWSGVLVGYIAILLKIWK
jgi:transcriptional regulator with XRE-family HTH domain